MDMNKGDLYFFFLCINFSWVMYSINIIYNTIDKIVINKSIYNNWRRIRFMIDRRTGVSVDKRIKERLDNYKLTPSETYENIIVRLIEKHKGRESDK